MIAAATLLKDLRDELRKLEVDLRQRCDGHPDLDQPFRDEWTAASTAGRTALTYPAWRDGQLTQVGVAWLLAGVFVRFCEDNHLIDTPMLGGPDGRIELAKQHRTAYFRTHVGDGDREWLAHVFTSAANLPGMDEVLGQHNPLWRLGPTADGARAIIGFWEQLDVEHNRPVHDFTDVLLDTRFLGDLYQDLSEVARKTFALLQTPQFVESFILDRTLDTALNTFGVEDTDLIDPACGSGHFLLGAFDRLLPRWEGWYADHEPSATRAVVVQRALDQIAGVDLNPFAIAITRFRLLVAAFKASGLKRLSELHHFHVNVAVGDSLLGAAALQLTLPGLGDENMRKALEHAGAFDDQSQSTKILSKQYAAVVGNPPYVTVKDPALNALYRASFVTCHRSYSLGVPFTELFWRLAREDEQRPGFVGMITTNSFMKREFGSKLIEQWVPVHDVTHVIDTRGVAIPGHSTPTVILFGRNRIPASLKVRAVMGIRGEPPKLADPAKGLVWSSIIDMVDHPGSENGFVSVADLDRSQLAVHPWSIGGGGAAELKQLLDGTGRPLSLVSTEIGRTAHTGDDDAYVLPASTVTTQSWEEISVALVVGEDVRDWAITPSDLVLFPYDISSAEPTMLPTTGGISHHYWKNRSRLRARLNFGETNGERDLGWHEYTMFFPDRFRSTFSIAFAFVATHNHFVLDRGGKVFKQTAPVVKLRAEVEADEQFTLLAILNSAVACFWMRQVSQPKNAGQGGAEPYEWRYEFDGTKVGSFPLPPGPALDYARQLDCLAQRLASLSPAALIKSTTPTSARLAAAEVEWLAARGRMIAVQEELDWHVAHLYGLTPGPLTLPLDQVPSLALGERAFEIVLARKVRDGEEETSWFARHGSKPIVDIPVEWPYAYRSLVERRIEMIEQDLNIGLIEKPEHKRRWATTSWADQVAVALRSWMLDRLEFPAFWAFPVLQTCANLADQVRVDPEFMEVARLAHGQDVDITDLISTLVAAEAVPFLASHRYSADGLRVRAQWESTWELQRAEDRGEIVGAIPVPPKYGRTDYAKPSYWTLRGKLDVPKERFVSYPGLERGNDTSLVIGWAGWNHVERAQALAGWYVDGKEAGTEAERLVPMLAGLWELVPWLLQWHNDRDPATGERLGSFYQDFVTNEAAALGVSTDDLAVWKPEPTATRRRRKT